VLAPPPYNCANSILNLFSFLVADILLADRLWYGRFVGQQISITGLDQQLVADRHQLSDALLQQVETLPLAPLSDG
jgi:hypothetical protein